MSQLQERRRSRGRGGRAPKPGNTAAEHQASVNHDEVEDAQTFWARSNARLGIEAENDNASTGKRGRGPVEFPCAVCGEWVQPERWPKDRHEVRCENCKAAVAGLLVGDDKHIAAAFRKARKAELKGKYEGLPEMSAEDVEAVREMRTLSDAMGNGRVGNRRRPAGPGEKRKRKGKSEGREGGRDREGREARGGGGGRGDGESSNRSGGGGEGGGGRRRRKRKSAG